METPEIVPSPFEYPHGGMPGHPISDDCIGELADLFEQSPNIFIRCDENGQMLYANRVSVHLFNAEKILPGSLLQPCRRAVETKSSQACEATLNFERYLFIIVPDVDKKRVSVHGKELAPSPDRDAQRLRAAMACLEKEKQDLATLLVQAQKLDTLGTLARGVVRDFSNIMTTIAGYTGLCIERTKKEDPPRYFLHKIMDISRDAMNTIRQLNLFGKNATLDFKSIDCNTVISNVLPLLKRSTDDTVSIETDLGPGLRTIWGKEEMIEQAIMNLALSGVCLMSTGGRLTIKTSNVTIDKEYCAIVSDATTGPAIMISVADTGPCISSKQHIFDPCAQIKQAGKGLELPVACMIVKLHNGWMTAESRRETGTEIRTYLPAEKIKQF